MMREEYIVPEGDTDTAVEFIEKMFPDQRRHLVAIPQKGRWKQPLSLVKPFRRP
ncbi:hypothetical protein [Mesorhizobium sp. B2-4-9]|uniref:hypothetical protein n=1 Tax=Mesorhizobium sp. B2-4-9 TaxID=2589940 RepID=UPI0015E2D84A|nr:hypothetical protein [Mesorhizobium sp. B2-4-9]